MLTYREVQVAAELRRDALATAQRERLINEMRGGLLLRQRYQQGLAALGARMVAWGNRLQARYADVPQLSSAIQAQR